MIDVSCSNTTHARISLEHYAKLATWLLKQLGIKDYTLSIVFCGDTRMRRLNHEYRGKDMTTDVLSFAYDTQDGEVIISLPKAKRQAKMHKITIKEELCDLLIHGILHLLGYDHETPKEAKKMFSKQDALLKKAYARFC